MKSGYIAKMFTVFTVLQISNFFLYITCIDLVVNLIFHWKACFRFKNFALGKQRLKKKNGNVRGAFDLVWSVILLYLNRLLKFNNHCGESIFSRKLLYFVSLHFDLTRQFLAKLL